MSNNDGRESIKNFVYKLNIYFRFGSRSSSSGSTNNQKNYWWKRIPQNLFTKTAVRIDCLTQAHTKENEEIK